MKLHFFNPCQEKRKNMVTELTAYFLSAWPVSRAKPSFIKNYWSHNFFLSLSSSPPPPLFPPCFALKTPIWHQYQDKMVAAQSFSHSQFLRKFLIKWTRGKARNCHRWQELTWTGTMGSCADFETGYFYLKGDTKQDVLMSYALFWAILAQWNTLSFLLVALLTHIVVSRNSFVLLWHLLKVSDVITAPAKQVF